MRTFLFILLALSLLSCGTKKVTKSVVTNTVTDIIRTDSITSNDSILYSLSTLLKEKLTGTIKLIEWSVPDSTGHQYKVREADITISYDKESNTQKDSLSVQSETAIRKEKKQLKEESNQQVQTIQNKRFIPNWVWWFVLIGGIIAAILAWIIHKR